MSESRTIYVAGLGRCGTTLVMNMLDAAGVPTVGEAPDWEDQDAQRLLETDPVAWAERVRGKATKLLDAHRWTLPPVEGANILWLSRDPVEQAKSMIKLLNAMFPSVASNRENIRAMAAGIKRDSPAARAKIEKSTRGGCAFGALRFEHILARPSAAAEYLCSLFGIPEDRASRMAAVVRSRSPRCLPYLAEAYAA